MKKYVYALVFLLAGIPSIVQACMCDTMDEKEFASKAKNVFVIKIQSKTNNVAAGTIQKQYRGKATANVEFIYPKDAECINEPLDRFKIGHSYLIATNRYNAPSTDHDNGKIESRICEIYSDLKDSKALIQWLNSKEFKKLNP